MDVFEVRESLKPLLNKRVLIEARVQKFSEYHDYKLSRRVPSTLLIDVEQITVDTKDNEQRFSLTTHCWCMASGGIEEIGALPGDVIRAEVLVYKYFQKDKDDHNRSITRYGIRDPIKIEVVRSLSPTVPFAPAIYTPPAIIPMVQPDPEPPIPPKAAHPGSTNDRSLLLALMDLVDQNGIAKVKKVLQAVEKLQAD